MFDSFVAVYQHKKLKKIYKLHRGAIACVTDGVTPFYVVCVSGGANTQALLTYLKLKTARIFTTVGCHGVISYPRSY